MSNNALRDSLNCFECGASGLICATAQGEVALGDGSLVPHPRLDAFDQTQRVLVEEQGKRLLCTDCRAGVKPTVPSLKGLARGLVSPRDVLAAHVAAKGRELEAARPVSRCGVCSAPYSASGAPSCTCGRPDPVAVSAPEPTRPCSRCQGPLTKGPFVSACPKCDGFQFQPCGICGTQRVFCCC